MISLFYLFVVLRLAYIFSYDPLIFIYLLLFCIFPSYLDNIVYIFLWFSFFFTAIFNQLIGSCVLFSSSIIKFFLTAIHFFVPRNSRNCIILDCWVFGDFISFDELLAKGLQRLVNYLLVKNKLCMWKII